MLAAPGLGTSWGRFASLQRIATETWCRGLSFGRVCRIEVGMWHSAVLKKSPEATYWILVTSGSILKLKCLVQWLFSISLSLLASHLSVVKSSCLLPAAREVCGFGALHVILSLRHICSHSWVQQPNSQLVKAARSSSAKGWPSLILRWTRWTGAQ